MWRRWWPALLILAGALLLVGPPVVWHLAQPAPTVGEVAPAAVAPATVTMRRIALPAPPPAPDPPVVGALPSRVVVPAIDVDHPVIEVRLEADGSMEVPDDVHEIGWFTGTRVRPGDPGSAVLAGHVDSRTQGRGAFFALGDLDVDDEIHLDTDGGEQRWRVTGRTSYDKSYLPIDDIFTVDGDPRLVLITCGGPFDSDTRHYTQNIVVYAEPAGH